VKLLVRQPKPAQITCSVQVAMDEIAAVLQLALVLSIAYLAWVVRDAAAQLTERLDGFGEVLERIERRLGTAVVAVARSMDAIQNALEKAEREPAPTPGGAAGPKHAPRQAAPRGAQSTSPQRGSDRSTYPPGTSGPDIVERRRLRTSSKLSSEMVDR
jgi:hypothetical protein